MKYFFYLVLCFLLVNHAFGQLPQQFENDIRTFHSSILQTSCAEGRVATNRAVNLFLADRIGYYLSGDESISFCKNNVGLNTATGVFALTHSLFEPTGADTPIKNFTAVGLRVNAFDVAQAIEKRRGFSNQLGLTYKRYWLSNPTFTYQNCIQKTINDAYRAVIVEHTLAAYQQELTHFSQLLSKDSSLNQSLFKSMVGQKETVLAENYARQFAYDQFISIFENMHFKKVKINWTQINAYIPAMRQTLMTAPEPTKSYPIAISTAHTRFSETSKAAKFFQIYHLNFALENQQKYDWSAAFYTVISPSISAKFVYFPPMYHFGISASIEAKKVFSTSYNAKIGIPVVLIDKNSHAASNFEIVINVPDLSGVYFNTKMSQKMNVSVVFGLPIGRNVY
jgi:hypothetical protein